LYWYREFIPTFQYDIFGLFSARATDFYSFYGFILVPSDSNANLMWIQIRVLLQLLKTFYYVKEQRERMLHEQRERVIIDQRERAERERLLQVK